MKKCATLSTGKSVFKNIYFLVILILILTLGFLNNPVQTQTDSNWRTFGILDANQLSLVVYNYGCFGHELNSPSFEWPRNSNIHYGKRFGLIVGGEAQPENGNSVVIVSHSLDFEDASESNVKWWEPQPGYSANPQDNNSVSLSNGFMALNTRPETWGAKFPVDDSGKQAWPGQFGAGKSLADVEIYYKMDDRKNAQDYDGKPQSYYPDFPNKGIHGLGIEVTGRGCQFVTTVASDMIFLLYEIKNYGNKPLKNVVTGIFGDPQIGGRSDSKGDFVSVNADSDFVFLWDENTTSNAPATPSIGYLAYAFLETPGEATDGVDNDHDGIVDESQYNLIDDDSDWQATDFDAGNDPTDFDGKSDDLGKDGLRDTGDEGENNGRPDLGEPDFEICDLDEVDQLHLTSVYAKRMNSFFLNNRRDFWNKMEPGKFVMDQGLDLGLLLGSGSFSLSPQQVQKLSLLCLLSDEKQRLFDKIAIAQKIYHYNFNFLKPPELPALQAEARDGAVQLTWDERAEKSFDPITDYDFEGYALYRSTDGLTWGEPVTNSQGKRIYDAPIVRFDKVDQVRGYHPVENEGVRFYLGDDSGLQHSYLDQNLINGITYFYALTAYDTGSVRYGIEPRECSKKIGNSNVVAVTPRSEPAGSLDKIYVVPNPYVTHSLFDRGVSASSQGNTSGRNVMFVNLPSGCKIRIYTAVGELIREIVHEESGGDCFWDLLNQDGLEVAAGIYIYHIEAPDLGNKVGRLAIIK